jgi:hypothetical protein
MKATTVGVRVERGVLTVEIDGNGPRCEVSSRCDYLLPFTALAEAPYILEVFEFMSALYAADRLVPRSARAWTRWLNVTFPVSRLGHWTIARPLLEELIWSATGDNVTLNFVQRAAGSVHRDRRHMRLVLDHQTWTSVVLLSEGLDSLCGAFRALDDSADRVAFVSLVTNSRKAARIQKISSGIGARYGERAVFHRVRDLHLVEPPEKQEPTQRTRGLLAIAAGLTVAAAYESRAVSVSENGTGILNLPITTLQTRHESSQVLHPQNLRLWSSISELLLSGATVRYSNRFRTKAEMLADIPVDARDLIWTTSSCDAPQRSDKNDDCGVCGSCDYRRFSLRTAGIADRTQYTAMPPIHREYDPAGLRRLQAQQLSSALHSDDQWRALVRLQPTLRTAIEHRNPNERTGAIASTIELLRRHVAEVLSSEERLAHAI